MSAGQPEVSALVEGQIEYQRGRLQRASALLHCAVMAAHEGVDADDVAEAAIVARELINAAVEALDIVELSRTRRGVAP